MTITSTSSGFITSRDRESLIELAAAHGVVIHERKSVGDNIVVDTPLALWWTRAGASTMPDAEAIAAGVQRAHAIGYELTAAQDFDYGVQQIVEIGVRALSPGVNDPATAMHALGHLSALVASIVSMPAVPESLADSDGKLALITKTAKPSEIVDGALALIRHYGGGDPSLVHRFLQLIEDLRYTSDDPAVRSALLHQLAALDEQLAEESADPAAVAALRVAVEKTTLSVEAWQAIRVTPWRTSMFASYAWLMSVSELSVSTQNYLKAVWSLSEWSDVPVTQTLIAEKTGLKLSSVSDAVRKLSTQGLLDHAPYGAVRLTDIGRAYALAMVRRHRLIEAFLVEVLGYGWDQIHDEAESLEHAVSDFMVDRIDAFLEFPTRDPHGDPIPAADGTVALLDAVQLTTVGPGGTVAVERISDSDPDLLKFFEEHGIVFGARLVVSAGAPYSDALNVQLVGADGDASESPSVALGRAATDALYVS